MASFGTIYSYPNNPRVMKTQAAANFNGLTLTNAEFTMRVTNREPSFLAKFPMGKVPAFEAADGTLLVESDAITQYVADSGPAAGQLLGENPAERALIRQWICFADTELNSSIALLAYWRLGFREYSENTEKEGLEKLNRSLEYMEKRLADRTWIATDRLSLADISVVAALYWGFALVIDAEMRKNYPGLVAWYERTIESEHVKEAFGPKNFVEKRKEAN
ncbi:glutathione S-transferase family protein [Aspergillus ibericus CBS 121593]|uniref:Translation elongation factor eEF-1B gamma subunit n=1 Tax=Aspergillus ibericus CBS 121593 TaxID=1448316 RepID=A0A395HCK8_9EURO|nr:translation elongation factor eEF-1B gamma subunit [Aspergillus ibericus CBS 121593]RAL05542.1 translation elongation factor eEF-1B gamma subunit [Aspergillus ibericus CBS 121593]